jgi:hypothetical protein
MDQPVSRQPQPAPDRPAPRPPGPSVRGIGVLVLAALAIVATTPPLPSLEGRVIGEVGISTGEDVRRELRIHVDPEAGDATAGTIDVKFQSASGMRTGSTRDATVGLADASDADGSFPPSQTFPLERCTNGCDLVYGIVVSAGPRILPGSVVRYTVDVQLHYSSGSPGTGGMRLELEGAASGPVVPVWAVLAGVVALLLGLRTAPRLDLRLPSGRRHWPALGLAVLALVTVGWSMIERVAAVVGLGVLADLVRSPTTLLSFADPWSVGLGLTLAWGVWRGVRRWPVDGGWLLGIAAVALVGLGGLWWTYWSTLDPVIQPVVLAASFVVLGGLGGVVIGQAWRTDLRARHDRGWAAVGVLAHGIIIAGFGFMATTSLSDPFGSTPTSLVLLIPIALVALAFGRWLYGRRNVLIVFDLLIAGIGLFGAFIWTSLSTGLSTTPTIVETDDVAIGVAVVASLVALVASFHAMPPRMDRATAATESITPPPAPVPPTVATPPTS